MWRHSMGGFAKYQSGIQGQFTLKSKYLFHLKLEAIKIVLLWVSFVNIHMRRFHPILKYNELDLSCGAHSTKIIFGKVNRNILR